MPMIDEEEMMTIDGMKIGGVCSLITYHTIIWQISVCLSVFPSVRL